MSDITLNFRPEIEPNDIHTLMTVLPRIGQDEHLTIVVERTDAHKTDELVEILEDNGFDYQPRGGHDDEYSIVARRKKGSMY